MVKQVPKTESLFVLIDANARIEKRMEVCDDGRVLGAYERDELNNNGKRLPSLASDNKLDLTNTFFSGRKGGTSHTFNGINIRNDRKRIDYILTRHPPRPRVSDVKVNPPPPAPAKADSDHNIVYATVRLSGRISLNRRIGTNTKSGLSTGRSFDLTEIADSELLRGSFPSFLIYSCKPTVSLKWPSPSPRSFLML